MNFSSWLHENRPLLSAINEKYPHGIKPADKFGNKETVCGSWINWSGEPSDTAAMALNVSEQYLIDTINCVYKRNIRAEYHSSKRGPDFTELFNNASVSVSEAAASLNDFFSIESKDIKYRGI